MKDTFDSISAYILANDTNRDEDRIVATPEGGQSRVAMAKLQRMPSTRLQQFNNVVLLLHITDKDGNPVLDQIFVDTYNHGHKHFANLDQSGEVTFSDDLCGDHAGLLAELAECLKPLN